MNDHVSTGSTGEIFQPFTRTVYILKRGLAVDVFFADWGTLFSLKRDMFGTLFLQTGFSRSKQVTYSTIKRFFGFQLLSRNALRKRKQDVMLVIWQTCSHSYPSIHYSNHPSILSSMHPSMAFWYKVLQWKCYPHREVRLKITSVPLVCVL